MNQAINPPKRTPLGAIRATLRGGGQVMFQGNALTGALFLVGIFWGSYCHHTPAVAWGAVVGLITATTTGRLMHLPEQDGDEGMWGFNGILVGCAFPSFLSNTPLMWALLIFCAALSTWLRTGFNRMMAPWKINSLTFPFIFATWIFFFAAQLLHGMHPEGLIPTEPTDLVLHSLSLHPLALLEYTLKGIAQVFLINSWVTGLLFLIGLWVCSGRAALWAFIGALLGTLVAILLGAPGQDIANGLYGYAPVLTAIALGATFYKMNHRSVLWALIGTVTTVFVQAASNALMMQLGIPTFTVAFCLTTWLFLLPLYRLDERDPDHSSWHRTRKKKTGVESKR
jgi:urea transporter